MSADVIAHKGELVLITQNRKDGEVTGRRR